jgi:hypothetical protein
MNRYVCAFSLALFLAGDFAGALPSAGRGSWASGT